jgi:hypothetical protein
MNYFSKKLLATFALLVLLAGQGFASSTFKDSLLGQINTITTAVPFLMIAPDARAGGMGDNGVATSPDPNSVHWNAAKLAFIDKDLGFSISYTPWLKALVDDISLAYLSGYKKFGDQQALAISLLYFSLGNIDFTDETGNPNGSFKPNEFAVDVAYSRKLSENFSGGLALRYIYSNLTGGVLISGTNTQTKAGTSVAADLSGFYTKEIKVSKKNALLTAGINISNIGAKMSYSETGTKDFIPTNFRLGAGLKMELDKYNTICFNADMNKLLVPTQPVYYTDSVDANGNKVIQAGKDPNSASVASALISSWSDAPGGFQEEMNEINYSLGTEYWYDNQFAIRAGYFHEAHTKGNRQFFTVGAGLRYNVFGLDFAYLIPTEQRNPLENTLRFTLLFNFEGLKKENKTEE